jgi:hypothetical protein
MPGPSLDGLLATSRAVRSESLRLRAEALTLCDVAATASERADEVRTRHRRDARASASAPGAARSIRDIGDGVPVV